MSKHTPGPWKRCGDERDGCPCGLVYATGADFGIATTYLIEHGFEMPMPDVDTRKANARLIAAAPELLDALTDALCALEVCGRNFDHVMGKARDAIAKAKGESV